MRSLFRGFQKRKKTILSSSIACVILCLFIVAFLVFKHHTVKTFKELQSSQNINTVFYDIDRKPFHIISGIEDRKYVTLDKISRNLQMAVVAVEDARFFKHFGFDPVRLVSVIIDSIFSRGPVQGASTITQQLVKLTLLSPERTIKRKVIELFMAVALEMEFSKAEILEFYLNKVYLGHGNYGVENASLNYFHKSTSKLSIAEAAFIAGLIKKPEGYSPFANLRKARERQLIVLNRLRVLDWITRQEYIAAANEYLLIRERKINDLQSAPFFVSHILQELKTVYGHKAIYGGGLHVYTTLDSRLQNTLETVINERLEEDRSFEEIAAVSLDPTTGFVKALVGGEDFFKSEFNRVTQAERQPGSSFKPILYSAALMQGIKPTDVFWDEPTQYTRVVDDDIEIYEPGNFTGEHLGQITVAYALRISNNVVSVKILNEIGIPALLDVSKRFGIDLPGERGLCLALGCGETTLLDLVDAYSVFANQGFRNIPVFILKVTDSNGNVLETYQTQKEQQILPFDIAYQMNRMLQDVVNLGTGRNAKIDAPAGGKTGTSDMNRDAWFIGFTADLVTGFWIGNDDNTPMENEVGGKTPARLWHNYMEKIPSPFVQKEFASNHNFEDHLICDHSGKLATAWCPIKAWYPVRKDSTLREYCDLHTESDITAEICRSSGKLATPFCPPVEIETRHFVPGTEPVEPCDVHTEPPDPPPFP